MNDLLQTLPMLPHMQAHPELRLVTWHPQGLLDDELVNHVVALAEAGEGVAVQPFNRFTNLNGLTGVKLSFGHLYRVSQRRRTAYTCTERVKSAFFCSRGIGYASARIYAALMQGAPIEVRAFQSLEAAAEWLEVPIEILQEPQAGSLPGQSKTAIQQAK